MPTQEPRSLGSLAKSTVGGLEGVGDKRRDALEVLGVHTVLDLVTFYPRRWIDRTNEARVSDLVPGQVALVLVTVRSVAKRQTRNRRSMVTAAVGDGSGRLSVVFFNQPWRERQLRPDLQVALFGKAEVYRGGLQMTNPGRRPHRRPHRAHRGRSIPRARRRPSPPGRSPAWSSRP